MLWLFTAISYTVEYSGKTFSSKAQVVSKLKDGRRWTEDIREKTRAH